MGRRRLRSLGIVAGAFVLIGGGQALPASAAPTAQGHHPAPVAEDPAPTGPDCTTTPSTTQPGYSVADPRCTFTGAGYTAERFVPLTDAAGQPATRVFTGIVRGAAYRIEVPLRWNGELALNAHGYRGTGTTVYVDNSPLRAHFVARGFAWASSSYATNGYDPGQGAIDSHTLIALLAAKTGKRARAVYMTGGSMGGHVTAVEIERYRGDFVGAMPFCGVLGDKELFDFFLDANVTAAALSGTPIRFPATLEEGTAYAPEYAAAVTAGLPKLGSGFVTGNPAAVTLTDAGKRWAGVVEQRSGGTRPGFAGAFAYWSSFGFAPLTTVPFLFGVYPGLNGGSYADVPGNVTDNRFTLYRTDPGLRLDQVERKLNRDVLRVGPTATTTRGLDGLPKVFGDPRIPVMSLHDLGDLFVPYSMEQIYAQRVAARGQSRLFVHRAIRGVGHCDFTPTELTTAFDDLVHWVRTGARPAGDRLLDRRAVAAPSYGCRFTDKTPGTHVGFVGTPCP